MDVYHRAVARKRIDRQRRAKRRAADADVDQVPHISQCAGVDRPDQRIHPRVEQLCFFNRRLIADSALGSMHRRPALRWVDDIAGEQRSAASGKIRRCRQINKRRQMRIVEMGFRPVELNAAPRQV